MMKPLEYNELKALKEKKIYFIYNNMSCTVMGDIGEGVLVRNGSKIFNVKFDEEEKSIQLNFNEFAVFKNKQDLLDFLELHKLLKKFYWDFSIRDIQEFLKGELQEFLGINEDSLLNDLNKVKQKLIVKEKELLLQEISKKEKELETLKRALNSVEEKYEKD